MPQNGRQRKIALEAPAKAAEKGVFWVKNGKKHTSGAKARVDFAAFLPGMNPWPTARRSFSAACAAALVVGKTVHTIAQQLSYSANGVLPSAFVSGVLNVRVRR
jgi:hypothetical protein